MNRAFQAILVGIALLLASCGGGQLTAGIEGSGAPVTTVGSITGFGSIFVNGVEYATAGAQIGIDGQPGTEAQLSVGDVVTVVGDRKSTRLNSSHLVISYAVFCLKKKTSTTLD